MQQSCQLEADASVYKQSITHLRMRSAQALTAGRLSIKLLAPAAGKRAR